MSLSFIPISAQTTPADFTVQGNVRGSEGVLLPGATLIVIQNNRLGVSTDGFGAFELSLPSLGPWTLRCSMIGYEIQEIPIDFEGKQSVTIQVVLKSTVTIGAAEIIESGRNDVSIQRIDPRVTSRIPTPRGTVEDVLLQAPVNFTSEL
ncbi:MAG: carboxypeptidase-like regulatory domain-containing protein, partial [Flavobacteriales bacterium]